LTITFAKMFPKRFYLLLILMVCSLHPFSQNKVTAKHFNVHDSSWSVKDSLQYKMVTDSLLKDSIATALKLKDSLQADSIKKAMVLKTNKYRHDTATYSYLMDAKYYPFFTTPLNLFTPARVPNSRDIIFYTLLTLLILLAVIRISFTKYINNLFTLFFQTSFRQNQTRDQMTQDRIASLLMNLIFLLCGGIYISLLTNYYEANTLSFTRMFLYGVLAIAIIYSFKYLLLSFFGWIFNIKETAKSYNFVVFLLNKIIGVCLIPFLWLIAFSDNTMKLVAITISICILIILFIYRYIVGISIARNGIQLNAYHFFLYLCCIEILPLILLFKVFNLYIGTIN